MDKQEPKTTYRLSTDHVRLRELLLAGFQIACFVDYRWKKDREPLRDLCLGKYRPNEKEFTFGVRGIEYTSCYMNPPAPNYPTFEDMFRSSNIAFIDPGNPDDQNN